MAWIDDIEGAYDSSDPDTERGVKKLTAEPREGVTSSPTVRVYGAPVDLKENDCGSLKSNDLNEPLGNRLKIKTRA